ncbi:amidohydrolase [Fusobacterium sp.]|uniref:M20 metallopeptidase family protein n=1 Tax=Fusobacterium sp. TaxID=68766 RepID=UPI0028FE0DD4|nr:amidohydrolase [Fusobacterium sp.]MDU1912568.1 amidohydrolase [Fusobacterium sp.]
MNLQNIFFDGIENSEQWLIETRRELHQHPELDFDLSETTGIICRHLDEIGIPYRTGIGKSGIVADLIGKNSNITIALRADIDALPILENTECEYSSKNTGKMHACGHDAHASILLGTAKILTAKKKDLPCNVRFIFQPAEETTGGAIPMIKDGVLEGVNCIFGLHVDPSTEAGKIAVKYGAMNASATDVNIKITGKSCHGAYPSGGVDAVVTAAYVITALQTIVSRNIDSRDSLVLTFGTMQSGTKENIIAQEAFCCGTMRSLSNSVRDKAKKRINSIVEMVSAAYEAKGEVFYRDSYNTLINYKEYVELVKINGENILGIDKVKIKELPDMGVEDFAYFLEKIPGTFFNLGVGNREKGITSPLHNDKFNIDESSLIIGVKMQISNILSAYEKFFDK